MGRPADTPAPGPARSGETAPGPLAAPAVDAAA
ncbi:hypothetical protein GA0115235_12261, partial [Streptomyces sp. DpondAA-F4a]